MPTFFAQFEEESKQKMLYKPHSGDLVVMHDGRSLDLYKTGSVVEMNSNVCGAAVGTMECEPENSVQFTAKIIFCRFNV